MLSIILAYIHACTRPVTFASMDVNTRICNTAFIETAIEVVLVCVYSAYI